MKSIKNKIQDSDGGHIGWLAKLWRLFSSIRLAVILILIITGLSLVGIFVTPEFFHSWLFLTPGILLMFNILICSINRWKNIKTIVQGSRIKQPDSFYNLTENKAEVLDLSLPADDVLKIIVKLLREQHYRVRFEKTTDRIYIAADKNRYFRLGTYLSHLSLIIFVLAYIIGSSFGFRENSFLVIEGETQEVGHNTHLSLHLNSFVDEYYADHTPKDYRSEVILLKDNGEIRNATIRVNHPLIYDGIRFYQSYFGPAVKLQLKKDGNLVYQGDVALASLITNQGYQRYIGYLDLPQLGISFRLLTSSLNLQDPMIPPGQLAIDVRKDGEQVGIDLIQKGVPLQLGGYEYIYQEDIQFSGFQMSHDPGNALIWVASILFMLGVVMVLYFVYHQVWISLISLPSDTSRILIRKNTSRGFSNISEVKNVTSRIRNEIAETNNRRGFDGRS